MKRILLMALIALALPIGALANSVDFTNHGGELSFGQSGMSLKGSELTEVTGFGGMGPIEGNLGKLNFSTGKFLSGTAGGDATFKDGGFFTLINTKPNDGLPKGIVFCGSFTNGPVQWTKQPGGDGYSLTGYVTGKWYNGLTVTAFVDMTFSNGKVFGGKGTLDSGDTVVTTVPEPGTLGLLGTGMLGLAGVLHRKLRA
jgi:hypothetical protein